MTHASRNTMTGLDFENAARIHCPSNAIDLTKNKLYSYLKDKGVDWKNISQENYCQIMLFFLKMIKKLSFMRRNFSNVMEVLMKNLRLVHLK